MERTIFHGDTRGIEFIATLAEDIELIGGDNYISAPVEFTQAADQLLVYRKGMSPATAYLSGEISNESDQEMIVHLHLAAGLDMPEFNIGSLAIKPGRTTSFVENSGFEQPEEEVEERLFEFFAAHPQLEHVVLHMTTEGEAILSIEWIELTITPVVRKISEIEGESFLSLSMEAPETPSCPIDLDGRITNLGEREIRFLLVLSNENQQPDFTGGIVADGYVRPGKAINIDRLLAPDGLGKLTRALLNSHNGNKPAENIFLLGDGRIDASIQHLKIRKKLPVGAEF